MPRRRPHKIKRRGGSRKGAGRKRKAPAWINYELSTKELVERFLVDTLRMTWTSKLGTRQASAINGTTRLLMESRGYIQKSNLTVIQAQTVVKFNLEELKQKLDTFSEEEQLLLSRAIAKLEASTST